MNRKSGILLHVTSLPGKYGIGSFGKEAYEFVDYLCECGQTYWQVLPLGTTLFGNSPYMSSSSFALNKNMISVDDLCERKLISPEYAKPLLSCDAGRFVNFKAVEESREKILRAAFDNFSPNDDYADFIEAESYWLKDFAKYSSLSVLNGSSATWSDWKITDPSDLKPEVKNGFDLEIKYIYFVQFLLYTQWKSLKRYANKRGIKIIGDFPFYVSYESSDCYANPDLFKLDAHLKPEYIAGCPPDAFCEEGQMWGNPVYNFKEHQRQNYTWFLNRFKNYSDLYDSIRIDHFRGFEAYWEIKSGSKNAVSGKWVKSPGNRLFKLVSEKFPSLEIIAEDLGFITEEVLTLRKKYKYPGMKIIQFAFDGNHENMYLPHNIEKESVVYTGTHDNDTINGWIFGSSSKKEVELAMRYVPLTESEGYNWGMIRCAWSSPANLAVTTYQDLLGFGSDCRMNTPSTVSDCNWSFKLLPEDLNEYIKKRLLEITRTYFRI